MEEVTDEKRQKNPREKANFLSIFSFWYTIPTFMKGYRGKGLNEDDLYETLSQDKAKQLGDRAEKLWNQQLSKRKQSGKMPSILVTVFQLFRFSFTLIGLGYAMVELVLRPLQIIILGWIISSLPGDKTEGEKNLPLYVALLLINTLVTAVINHGALMEAYHTGMKVRVSVCCLVYRKALKLSQSAFGQTTAGQMINLLSNDVNVYDRFSILVHFVWVGPIQLILFTSLMYLEVGVASLVGVFILILTVPFHAFLGKLSGKYRSRIAQRTDVRIRLMDEIIRGIEIIKMYAWEKSFSKIVAQARKFEIKVITISSYLKGTYLFYFIYISVPLFITIICYVLFGNYIDARKVFLVTAYYNTLGFTMATVYPQATSLVGEVFASSNRVLKFLLLSETNREVQEAQDSEYIIELKNATAKWNESSQENTLSNLNVNVKKGSLVTVIGSVGSGKSSFLQCLLKELPLISGSLSCNGSVSYASQEAWIFTGSVRQNILFGLDMDEVRYKNVVSVCALTTDFNLFPFGDRTIVGERGASLSGGQRARINLARAIYKNADVYLFDDPLSAVDTHVSRHIFEECIMRYLNDKTVILVTHQLQYLHHADHIINLEGGHAKVQGSYDEVKDKLYISLGDAEDAVEQSKKKKQDIPGEDEKKPEGPKEIKEQQSETYRTTTAFKDYLLASKNYYAIIFSVILFVLVQLTLSGSFFLMTHWVNYEKSLTSEIPTEETGSRFVYMYIYVAITIAIIFLILLRNIICYNICMNSSMNLHNSMFDSVVHASMHFFNTNSSGRILNRFSKDMGHIDELIPTTTIITIQTMFSIVGVMVVASVVNPWILIPSILIGIMFYYIRAFYLLSSLSIKRLEGSTRSPVFGHLNATLQGLTTIRALNAQDILRNEFDNKQDLHSCCYHLFSSTSRAFGFGLDVICFFYLTFTAIILFVISKENQGGNIGLVITQILQLMGQLQWGVRQSTEMENYMTSVERVLEYSDIEHERPFESSPDKKPPSSWPEEGKLVFNQVSLKYTATDSPVLHDLTFTIKSKEKIGIVGRTGAGKSSLIAAIFQLANTEGAIVLDEIDIQHIGLHDLRKEISIIPQNPVVFAGSIRKNLDPFDECSDDSLWKALEAVKLKDTIDMLDGGLNAKILDGGSNLSVGQRQLICLARAVLRDNKVLILDEATASVDPETDALIQKTLREKFANCTVLTVAHRLNTIMDSDKILVMDAGCVKEFDHPYLLLESKGIFYGMVQETEAMASVLTKIAKDKYESS